MDKRKATTLMLSSLLFSFASGVPPVGGAENQPPKKTKEERLEAVKKVLVRDRPEKPGGQWESKRGVDHKKVIEGIPNLKPESRQEQAIAALEKLAEFRAHNQDGKPHHQGGGWAHRDEWIAAMKSLMQSGAITDDSISQRLREKLGFPGGGDNPIRPPRRDFPPEWTRLGESIAGESPTSKSILTEGLMKRGDYKEAAEEASKWALMAPRDPDPYVVMGNAYHKLGDYTAAHDSGMKALNLEPRNPQARSLVKLTQGRAAPTSPARAPEASPDFSTPAFQEFRAPIDPVAHVPGGPDSSQLRASHNLAVNANTLLKQRDYRAAAAAASRAVSINPKNINAHVTNALSLLKTNQYKDAVRAAHVGLQYAPKNSQLLAIQALAFNNLKEYGLALQSANEAIVANPENAGAYIQKAWAQDALGGQRAAVLAALGNAARINPRYQPYFDKAAQLSDGEFAALMEDDLPAENKKPESAGAGGVWTGGRSALYFGLASVVGGFLIALGLLRSASWKWKNLMGRWTNAFSRQSPSVGDFDGSSEYVSDALRRNYDVSKEIGVGGMGIVYEGLDRALDRRVAIKKMRDEIRSDPRERDRFLSEAKTVATLHHPNIVEIFSIVEDRDDAFLIFEFVNGKTVHEIIQLKKNITFAESIGIVRGIARALDYAHAHGVIHRDLKPSNIMVNKDGDIKVMDFGVARLAKDSMSRMSRTNTVVGTPPYMAPEQEQGMIRKASDVYSLAVMLYEMVTGQLPFQGVGAGMLMTKINKTYVPAGRLVSGLPEGFDAAMDRALEPDPEKRWQSGGQFLSALERLSCVFP